MVLSAGTLEQAWNFFANESRAPRYLLVHQKQYEDLRQRYAWQAENPTHNAWEGYNWHHGMKDQVRAQGLARRRRWKALRRSRAATR